MQTSASITNSTVSTKSLAERPKRMRGDGDGAPADGSISSRVGSNLPYPLRSHWMMRRTVGFADARGGDAVGVTNGHPFGLGTVILAIWPAHHANSISLILCLLVRQSHMGKFRIRKGDPWNCIVPHFDRQTKQRMPDHQSGMVIGHMGEHHAPCSRVPDRVNTAVRGLQAAVDPNAGSREFNSGLFQA